MDKPMNMKHCGQEFHYILLKDDNGKVAESVHCTFCGSAATHFRLPSKRFFPYYGLAQKGLNLSKDLYLEENV